MGCDQKVIDRELLEGDKALTTEWTDVQDRIADFHETPPLKIDFRGYIRKDTVQTLMKMLRERIDTGCRDIYLGIVSEGGFSQEADELRDFLGVQQHRGVRISTHNRGFVKSAASMPFLAGRQRFAEPYAYFLFHQAQFADAKRMSDEEIRYFSCILDQRMEESTFFFSLRSRISQKIWKQICLDEAIVASSDARTMGIIHGIQRWRNVAYGDIVDLIYPPAPMKDILPPYSSQECRDIKESEQREEDRLFALLDL